MDEGAWRTTVHGVTKSQTRLNRLSIHTHNLETNDTIITPRSEEAKGGVVMESRNTAGCEGLTLGPRIPPD